MSFSIYDASAPIFLHTLSQLAHVMDKGLAHAQAAGTDPATLLDARLAPDMFPLVRQVQSASDASKFGIARLTGVDAPRFEDTETTFEQLQQRIAKTRDFIAGVPRAAFDGAEDRDVVIKTGKGEIQFKGQGYLQHFALPNFFFHVSMAYAILRNQGAPVGKMDYLGKP
jgi:hypothetical protein